jgi:FdhD protein
MDPSISQPVMHWNEIYSTSIDQYIIGEEPLSIRIQENLYSVVMRTPGDEIPRVAGFCFGECIVDKPDDFTSFIYK